MVNVKEILDVAVKRHQYTLSEYESKQVLSAYGIPVVREMLVRDLDQAVAAASGIGYPLVLKACSPHILHKTDKGLLELDIRNDEELKDAFERLQERSKGLDVQFLIQEMLKGTRELVAGLTWDEQFGPCVMFGLGGILTEVLNDVSFRVAPIAKRDAFEMMQEIRGRKILGNIRGLGEVDLDVLSSCLINLGRIGLEHEVVQEIDINPLLVRGTQPVAVDALIVLKET
jgi:acetate---CoA ligase (ADP-forming) subunit beta